MVATAEDGHSLSVHKEMRIMLCVETDGQEHDGQAFDEEAERSQYVLSWVLVGVDHIAEQEQEGEDLVDEVDDGGDVELVPFELHFVEIDGFQLRPRVLAEVDDEGSAAKLGLVVSEQSLLFLVVVPQIVTADDADERVREYESKIVKGAVGNIEVGVQLMDRLQMAFVVVDGEQSVGKDDEEATDTQWDDDADVLAATATCACHDDQ
mmetsp:Transcript_13640/g.21442  ORF Transcript_13640/g.21442 Transcript_13640/m.21442 type:complete len:208 (+) Transcript_13640:853-1476(+)